MPKHWEFSVLEIVSFVGERYKALDHEGYNYK